MQSNHIIRSFAGVSVVAALVAGCGTTSPVAWRPSPASSQPTPVAPEPVAAPVEPQPVYTAQGAFVNTRAESASPEQLIGTTTNVRRVTFAEEGADFDPSVSSDGTRLVFASTQHRPTSDIYIKRTDSRVVTQLTTDPAEDAMPALSPDGTKIAFASNRSGNWDVYVMSSNGGKAVQVTSDSADEIQPSWSPDGTQLVFSRQGVGSGRWELWVTAIQNAATANFIGFGMHPRWCPVAGTGEAGADKILYQLGRDRGRRSFSIWTLDYSSGSATNTTEIAGSAAAALINPSWSPDGHWIAYAEAAADQVASGKRPGSASLWMVSAEGEGKVRLTTDTAASFSPVWASSNRLYFTSNMGGAENVWSLDVTQALTAAMATVSGEPAYAATPAEHAPEGAVANVHEEDPSHR